MCNSPTATQTARTQTMGATVPWLPDLTQSDPRQLGIRGQRQIGLPSRAQFSPIVGVTLGPPKDISRQT